MFNAVAMVALALVGQADADSAGSNLKLEVARLVRRLDSRELADREAAEKALTRMGPRALEFLPPGEKRVPAEVRQRLDRIKVILQKQQAEATAANSTVTLSGERMLLSEIFEAIQGTDGQHHQVRPGWRRSPACPLRCRLQRRPFLAHLRRTPRPRRSDSRRLQCRTSPHPQCGP